MADNVQPIIIKKIKKGGHGHHGGAWKVAYADFVTAMMAFFLLLWLLSSTTEEQKKGIADYFTPTVGIKDSKGIGFNGGVTARAKGSSRNDLSAVGIVSGQVQQGPVNNAPVDIPTNDPNAADTAAKEKAGENTEDADQFKATSADVQQALQEDDMKEMQNNVQVTETPEGLKIDMIDDPKKPMFTPEGAQLTDAGKKVLDSMSRVVAKTPNNISISGNTDSGNALANPQYTNWELSADRANAARRFLSTTVLEPERVTKVVGLADKQLLVPQEPNSPRNRRVTIIVQRGSYFRDPGKIAPTTRGLLSVPDGKLKKKEEAAPAAPAPAPEKPAESNLTAPIQGEAPSQ